MRTFVAIFLAATCVVACSQTTSSSSAATSIADASSDGGVGDECVSFAPFTCNVAQTTSLSRYDSARGCWDDSAPVPGICTSTIYRACEPGSVQPAYAFASDGTIYASSFSGADTLSGAGFRYWFYGDQFPLLPPDEQATDAEVDAAKAILCRPSCNGDLVFLGCQEPADGGNGVDSGDASDAD